IAATYPLIALADVLATFVVPALAFSVRRVREAIPLGLRTLRSEWPACAWYAIAPPILALVLSYDLLRRVMGETAARGITLAIGSLVALMLKGAVALFYLRRHPEVGPNGATVIRRNVPLEEPGDVRRNLRLEEPGDVPW